MRSEPVDYNHEECLSERIEWCQKFLELSGNMVEVVHVDKVGFIFFFSLFNLEELVETKMPTNSSNSKGPKFIFGGL